MGIRELLYEVEATELSTPCEHRVGALSIHYLAAASSEPTSGHDIVLKGRVGEFSPYWRHTADELFGFFGALEERFAERLRIADLSFTGGLVGIVADRLGYIDIRVLGGVRQLLVDNLAANASSRVSIESLPVFPSLQGLVYDYYLLPCPEKVQKACSSCDKNAVVLFVGLTHSQLETISHVLGDSWKPIRSGSVEEWCFCLLERHG